MSARGVSALAPTLPQVNLLPPEVRAKRGLARVKKVLLAVVAASFVAAALVVFFAVRAEESANADLAAQNEETVRLETEQAKYAEVPVVLSELDRVAQARALGMSTEVIWRDFIAAVSSATPDGVRISSLMLVTATPTTLAAPPTNALAAPSVGTLTFEAQSLTPIDVADWLERLETVPGFADAWFSSAVIAGEGDTPYYTVMATVQVDERVFANRFVSAEEAS